MSEIQSELQRRGTSAIISHPDAGKTTITEKLLLFGGAIQLAGSVKGRKAARHATSDWMEMEKERGISVTTSVILITTILRHFFSGNKKGLAFSCKPLNSLELEMGLEPAPAD